MRLLIFPFLVMFPFASVAVAAPQNESKALFALWEEVRAPYSSAPSAIGSYSAGCLAGAQMLPLDGEGYSVMRPSRLRNYGHPELVSVIEELGRKLRAKRLPLLLVGDLGRPRGGPMLSGHASHQIGLDVDLWYRMSKRRPTKRERENWSASSLVNPKKALTKAWTKQQQELVATTAAMDQVERIFVHAAIKRDLCQNFPQAPWLYKVRAWWGHADHLHARLRCPPGAADCQEQDPLDPANSQCGEELAWWFSQEADDELKKKSAAFAEREFPTLPLACERMVQPLRAEAK